MSPDLLKLLSCTVLPGCGDSFDDYQQDDNFFEPLKPYKDPTSNTYSTIVPTDDDEATTFTEDSSFSNTDSLTTKEEISSLCYSQSHDAIKGLTDILQMHINPITSTITAVNLKAVVMTELRDLFSNEENSTTKIHVLRRGTMLHARKSCSHSQALQSRKYKTQRVSAKRIKKILKKGLQKGSTTVAAIKSVCIPTKPYQQGRKQSKETNNTNVKGKDKKTPINRHIRKHDM